MDWSRKSKRKNSSNDKQSEKARLHDPVRQSVDEEVCRPKSIDNKPDLQIHDLIISSGKNETEIIQLLEKLIKDSNDINKITDGYSLTHRACLVGKPKVLEYLIQQKADINQKTCSGDTPLMCVLQSCNECDLRELTRRSLGPNEVSEYYGSTVCYSHMRCAKILLNQENIDLEATNNNGLSALSYATKNHDELKRDKYVKLLLGINDHQNLCFCLYKAIKGRLDSQFVMELNLLAQKIEGSKILQFMCENYTLLQAVCKFGMLESTKRLIQMGADVHFAPIIQQRPIELVCKYAQPQILQYLIQKNAHVLPKNVRIANDKKRNLLHLTAKSLGDNTQSHECLKILLKEKPSGSIGDVNEKDNLGKTPLHYAAAYDNELCVVELLENGALIKSPDKWNRTPLMHISPQAFKNYLNNMISGGKIHHNKSQEDLTFNFETLFQEQNGQYYFPTDFLRDIKKIKKLRKLLQHPIFSLIIHFKWENVRRMFYIYFFLYIAFCITYTILVVIESDLRNSSANVHNDTLYQNLERDSPKGLAWTNPNFCTNTSPASLILNTMLSIFTLLETFKIIGGMKKYFTHFENYLRLIVIIFAFTVVQCLTGTIFEGYCNHLKAVSLLLTWFEFFLVIGKHPKFSFYVTTFRSASVGLFKFLIIHFVLLLGFALSFHTLFRSDASDNIFTNPLYAIFKTTVMLTSEFDSGEIPFHGYPGISHAIFIAYIFIATIVLFNLMIGLAFSKVNEMEKNPSLYESLACIDIISHFEGHFLSRYNNIKIQSIFQVFNRGKKKTENESGIEKGVETRRTEHLPPKVLINKDNYFQTILKFDADGKITVLKMKNTKRIFCKGNTSQIYDQLAEKARKIVSKKVSGCKESQKDRNLNIKLDAIANELVTVKNFKSDSIVSELLVLKNIMAEMKELLKSQK